jgi:hypothetical protein
MHGDILAAKPGKASPAFNEAVLKAGTCSQPWRSDIYSTIRHLAALRLCICIETPPPFFFGYVFSVFSSDIVNKA